MEVNMAIFVMAVGILSMVALFPLGLRESTQGKADLQQSMFADYALNQIEAVLSDTNLSWSVWQGMDGKMGNKSIIPGNAKLNLPGAWKVMGLDGEPMSMNDEHYRIYCATPDGASDRVMGISVFSTDVDVDKWESYSNNPVYYTEVFFQGAP
mgnify:CR=1 FL=1